jgi:gamma-glutamylcyclotransferase (GGCT)/AIG2-like uncharacterized protein YtfP
MSDPSHIFVYGTLRSESDHPMARRLSSQARLIGKGTAPGRLYDFGWYPAAVFDAAERRMVVGDVFALPLGGRLLVELDTYEGGDAYYARSSLEVTLAGGGRLTAWAYGVREAPAVRLIPSGDFIAHRNARMRRPVRP